MENEEKREEQIMPYILNFEDGVRTLFAKYKAKELELQQECHEFSCKYRYDSGRNCAIGAMLPAEAIDKIIEQGRNGSSVRQLIYAGIIEVTSNTRPKQRVMDLLGCIQIEHDSALTGKTTVNSFAKKLRATMKEFGLN